VTGTAVASAGDGPGGTPDAVPVCRAVTRTAEYAIARRAVRS
jgi:hypothetical protein